MQLLKTKRNDIPSIIKPFPFLRVFNLLTSGVLIKINTIARSSILVPVLYLHVESAIGRTA